MKVRELIERLQDAHPDSEVTIQAKDGFLSDITDVDTQSDLETFIEVGDRE